MKTLSENVNAMNRINSQNTKEMADKLKPGLQEFDAYQKRSLDLPASSSKLLENR